VGALLRLHELRIETLIARSIGIALGGVLEVVCFLCVCETRVIAKQADLRIRHAAPYTNWDSGKKSNMESPSVGLGFDALFNITASKHIVTLLILHWIV
jgi:hypothetical protein